jgi:hypothetical protein
VGYFCSKEKFIAKYLDAILVYYESGEYKDYVEFFKRAYKEQNKFLNNFITP